MNIVVAIDSLKGSLTSLEAGNAIKEGILRVEQDANVFVRPLADGGEGTVEALVEGMNGTYQTVSVTGPLGDKVESVYGIIEETKTAIIEMSAAAGITLVPENQRNPLNTTTYGVGEIIVDALKKGIRRFIIGIGGSATNDCGIGMLQALGYEFLNQEGKQVPYGAKGIQGIVSICSEHVMPELKESNFLIACDVTNPLCGENGCSAIYGPQKGATEDMVHNMDQWILAFANLAKQSYPHANPMTPGTGAAGGLGFAFLTFTNAELQSGIQIVLKETKLENYVKECDYVITGEGRLDGQTAMGKAPIGVAKLAKQHDKVVLAFAGCVTPEAKECNKEGIDAFFPILRSLISYEEAMDATIAKTNMMNTVEQVFRLIQVTTK